MKILVLGAAGGLGRSLVDELARSGHEVIAADRSHGDVCSLSEMKSLFDAVTPSVVVHCAAYTDIDGAERDADRVYSVNALGTRNVAQCCEEHRAVLVYPSTALVFDGTRCRPYREFDRPNPLNAYGASKLEGEWYVTRLCRRFIVVRTSWLFGRGAHDRVAEIVERAEKGEEVKLVLDRVGTPTFMTHFAGAVRRLVESSALGVYHVTAQGRCNWLEFARRAVELHGLRDVRLTPVRSCELTGTAPRPSFMVLENRNFRLDGFEALPHWYEGLEAYMEASIGG